MLPGFYPKTQFARSKPQSWLLLNGVKLVIDSLLADSNDWQPDWSIYSWAQAGRVGYAVVLASSSRVSNRACVCHRRSYSMKSSRQTGRQVQKGIVPANHARDGCSTSAQGENECHLCRLCLQSFPQRIPRSLQQGVLCV